MNQTKHLPVFSAIRRKTGFLSDKVKTEYKKRTGGVSIETPPISKSQVAMKKRDCDGGEGGLPAPLSDTDYPQIAPKSQALFAKKRPFFQFSNKKNTVCALSALISIKPVNLCLFPSY